MLIMMYTKYWGRSRGGRLLGKASEALNKAEH